MNVKIKTAAAASALALGLATAPAAAQDVTIGWTAWSDAEAITNMAAQIIEENFDAEVEMTLADIAIQYQGVETGDLDMMLMAWLPGTHADYWENLSKDVIPVGPLYTGARLGWVVPNYMDEETYGSIADLASDEARDALGGEIQGIDPGAGLMRLSEEALDVYGLDGYEVLTASGAAMTAALDRAIQNEDPIVVTGWSPHWKFGAYDLRYLEDPEGALGGDERIHAMVRPGFDQDHPEIFNFLTRFTIDLDILQDLMAEAEETSYEEAVANFIDENENLVNYWVTGSIS